jgi:predicted transcriptional regulator
MSRKKIPSRDDLIATLKSLDGNMAATARRFHCSRALVWRYVNEDHELREFVDELSESFKDVAEQTLFNAIREGNIIATIFYLKTRGRDRGYSERVELALNTREIEVELGHPTIDTTDQTETLNGHGPAIALLEQ